MRTQCALVSHGALVSNSNNGTMTAVVVDTIRDNPRVMYASKVRALSADSLEQALSVELEAVQRQIRVTNKLLDEHNNPTYMMNKSQCFDLQMGDNCPRRSLDVSMERLRRDARSSGPQSNAT